MKTITEFAAIHLKAVAKIKQELLAAGKTAEELGAAMVEAVKPVLKIAEDRMPLLMHALEAIEKKPSDLKRVVVFSLAEGEKAPHQAEQKGEHHFLAEYFTSMQQQPAREEGRGGGRGGRGGGRGGDRGGRGGDRGGRGGERGGGGGRGERSMGAPRGDRPPGGGGQGFVGAPGPDGFTSVGGRPRRAPRAEGSAPSFGGGANAVAGPKPALPKPRNPAALDQARATQAAAPTPAPETKAPESTEGAAPTADTSQSS